MIVYEIDVQFHAVLLEVQRRFNSIIPNSVKVEEAYSIYRSFQIGATSEAQNIRISQTVFESNNRWIKLHCDKGMRPSWSMMQHYTDVQVAVPLLIQLSM